MLARRCDRLVSTDHPSRLARARTRLAAFPHVEVRRQTLPQDWPDERFDLIVLADVGVYLTPGAATRCWGTCCGRWSPAGRCSPCTDAGGRAHLPDR